MNSYQTNRKSLLWPACFILLKTVTCTSTLSWMHTFKGGSIINWRRGGICGWLHNLLVFNKASNMQRSVLHDKWSASKKQEPIYSAIKDDCGGNEEIESACILLKYKNGRLEYTKTPEYSIMGVTLKKTQIFFLLCPLIIIILIFLKVCSLMNLIYLITVLLMYS